MLFIEEVYGAERVSEKPRIGGVVFGRGAILKEGNKPRIGGVVFGRGAILKEENKPRSGVMVFSPMREHGEWCGLEWYREPRRGVVV